MATLSKRVRGKKGNVTWQLEFLDANGDRQFIALGKMPKTSADSFKLRVEELAKFASDPNAIFPKNLSAWIDELGDRMHDKFSKVGLIPKRVRSTVGEFVEDFIQRSHDAGKDAETVRTYRNAQSHLLEHFGAGTRLETITPIQVEDFRVWLSRQPNKMRKGETLAENTIRRRVGICRQFFNEAIRQKLVEENPFAGQSVATLEVRDRDFFITTELAERVLEACPSQEWRALFAMCQWGGLRCPSEILALTWDDVDWANDRFTVHCVKTDHYEGKETRVVPLFPEIKMELGNWFAIAPEGIHIFDHGDKSKTYHRTMLKKILKRASIEVWPKIFHNLRATRETELMDQFNIHKVCKWIGNSPQIALKHCAQMRDQDYEDAARWSAPESASKNGSKNGRE